MLAPRSRRQRLLIVHSSRDWLEAAKLDFGAEWDAVCASTAVKALELAAAAGRGRTFAAAIVDGQLVQEGETGGAASDGRAARELAIDLRANGREIPLLFVAPVRLELLHRYARGTRAAAVLEDEAETTAKSRSALDQLLRPKRPVKGPADWAMVEINIETEKVHFRISLAGGEIILDNSVPSNLRAFLEDWQTEFQDVRLYERKTGVLSLVAHLGGRLNLVGERLHQQLISDPQRTALERCLERVRSMDDIHFRFSLQPQPFPDVPFEAFRDKVRARFIRELAPVARRIALQPNAAIVGGHAASAAAEKQDPDAPLTGPVLFIKSDAYGTMTVGERTFNRNPRFSADRLTTLDAEYAAACGARKDRHLVEPVPCVLPEDGTAAAKLEQMVCSGPWDVVHYSGHSVRSDDGEVYLVLPGDRPGRPSGLRMAEFARFVRAGDVRLVLLSSCESTSSRSLFVLAQEGVPATIGFRWEVLASDAALFVERLHVGLAAGKPLGRAYLAAVRKLSPDCPSFLSPMLVVQQQSWACRDTGEVADVRLAVGSS